MCLLAGPACGDKHSATHKREPLPPADPPRRTEMAAENWTFDVVHSSVNFWVRHLLVSKVHGRFAKWTGTMVFDEQMPQSSRVEIEIDAASVDTKEPQRDAHLRSADFF